MSRSEPVAEMEKTLAEARRHENPPAPLAARIAELQARSGHDDDAYRWAVRLPSLADDYSSWVRAKRVVDGLLAADFSPPVKRRLRLAVLGSYTTNQLVEMIELVGRNRKIAFTVYEAGFDQYQQEILDSGSGLYEFEPDVVLLAVDQNAARLPHWSESPEDAVTEETERWASLWKIIRDRTGAAVVQTNFVPPIADSFGHLSRRLPGARTSMIRDLNVRLGIEAGDTVAIVDSERLAMSVGSEDWFDPRYWFHSKQGVNLRSVPLLAKHVVAVIGGLIGLARKCLVLDLDGTLWGGVIGEDGLEGISLGHGARGEAYVAFQEYVLALKERGVILAVCSKNDHSTAVEPFDEHPDMRLKVSDFAIFVANWERKPANLTHIASMLDIGVDSLVFVDDQPAERDATRQALPEVDVVTLPPDPAGFVKTLAAYPYFETGAFTAEDRRRTDQYRSRALAKEAELSADSLTDFLSSLEMVAEIAEVDALHLPRVVQLVGKTNQFNLTSRRHSRSAIEAMVADPARDLFYLKLRDRFTDHGLVGVCIVHEEEPGTLGVDTFLMSCRVISRTVEATMLDRVVTVAKRRGCERILGTFISSGRNAISQDVYERYGFREVATNADVTSWELGVDEAGPPNQYIEVS